MAELQMCLQWPQRTPSGTSSSSRTTRGARLESDFPTAPWARPAIDLSRRICIVSGRPGSGKTTLTPGSLLAGFPETQYMGIGMVLPKKIAADGLKNHLNGTEVQGMKDFTQPEDSHRLCADFHGGA